MTIRHCEERPPGQAREDQAIQPLGLAAPRNDGARERKGGAR